MKTSKFPLYVWSGALAFFVVTIWLTARQLPDRIATHFSSAGVPDGWMTRNTHMISFLALGIGMSIFIVGLCYGLRWFPAAKLNLPNRDYWRKPANRPFALDYLFQHAFWLGTLAFVFLGSVHYFIVMANQAATVSQATRGMQISSGLFIAGIVVWSFILIRHFQKVPGGVRLR